MNGKLIAYSQLRKDTRHTGNGGKMFGLLPVETYKIVSLGKVGQRVGRGNCNRNHEESYISPTASTFNKSFN